MTRDDAMQRLKKLGLKGEVGKGVASPDLRAEAKDRYARSNADHQDLVCRIEEQFGAERKAIAHRHDQALTEMTAYKFRVYRAERGSYMEVGKGDTWEEAFETVAPRRRVNDALKG